MQLVRVLRSLSVRAAKLRGTGLPRFSLWLQRLYQPRGGEITIDDFRGNLKIRLDLSDHMGSRIFWFDAYSRAELKLIQSLLQPGDVFIDAGANMGEFTLVAARSVAPHGKVLSIEPVPDIRAQLERHVAWNNFERVVSIVPYAVGEGEGLVSLFVPPDGHHQGLPTIFPSEERSQKIAEVQLTTIDRLTTGLDRVAGIKMDIEGGEPEALRGAIETLRKHRPWIICEMGSDIRKGHNHGDTIELLSGLGYSFAIIEECGALTPVTDASELRGWQNILARV